MAKSPPVCPKCANGTLGRFCVCFIAARPGAGGEAMKIIDAASLAFACKVLQYLHREMPLADLGQPVIIANQATSDVSAGIILPEGHVLQEMVYENYPHTVEQVGARLIKEAARLRDWYASDEAKR